VRAVKKTRKESRRIRRDWVIRAFSKVMRREPRMAVERERRRARSVRKDKGMRDRPRKAGKNRMRR
jgi:hypothetical protein